MLEIPPESLRITSVLVNAMSRHTFALVQPSKYSIENKEIATGVGVKWRGQYLILTAGHVVDHCPEETLRFFLPAGEIEFGSQVAGSRTPVEIRPLMQLPRPRPPVFADHPIDLAAIILPPQPDAEECFTVLDAATAPANGAQVGVFGYPGANKIPIGENSMARPEHLFAAFDSAGVACRHEPQQDFTIPYELTRSAKAYSGSGVWDFPADPIWFPQPQLCGILATECSIDKVASGYNIATVVKFLEDKEDLVT